MNRLNWAADNAALFFVPGAVYNVYEDKIMEMVPITTDGWKSRGQKKADRKRRSLKRRAMKMLERRGFRAEFVWYNGHDHYCEFTRIITDNYWGRGIEINCANDLIDNKLRLLDKDNNILYQNLDEYLMEQLIIKLSGLGK